MKWRLNKDYLFPLIFVSVFIPLLASISSSWLEIVIGYLLCCVPILWLAQKKSETESTPESAQSQKHDDNRNQSSEPNAVGKALVAQERRKFFSRLKMCAVFALFGCLGAGTVSGIWSGLLNRCSACGKFDAEKAHRMPAHPRLGPIYNCQLDQMKQFSVPKPRRDRLIPPLDDR